jgi:hypothetical protein
MVYVPFENGKEIDVTELLAFVIVTLEEGITVHEYEVGELLAEVEKDNGDAGLEHTTVGPLMALITGACAK